MVVSIYFPSGHLQRVIGATTAEPAVLELALSDETTISYAVLVCRNGDRIVAQFRLDAIAGYEVSDPA